MKHKAMSKSLLKEVMLAYHITAAMAMRANRLAAMRESDERISSISHTLPARPPAFYICPSIVYDLGGYRNYRIALLPLSS